MINYLSKYLPTVLGYRNNKNKNSASRINDIIISIANDFFYVL